jgi:ribosome-binding factor A
LLRLQFPGLFLMTRHGRSHAPVRGPSQRQLRAGELVRHALAEVFIREDFDDPDLKGAHVTISEVKMSPDLRHATAFVAPPPQGKDGALLVKALNRHQKFVRGELAGRVELKFSPEIVFRLDESYEQSRRIDELLRSPGVARDLE